MRILLRPLIVMTMTAVISYPVAHALTRGATTARLTATDALQTELIGATKWAAFVAEIRTTEPSGELLSRYYQNSQGSQRTEAYSPDKSQVVITIHNFERHMSYFKGPGGDWAMLPLIHKMRTQPRQMPINTPGLLPVPESRFGITVYEYTAPDSGVRALVAPNLNLFKMFSDNGTRQEEVIGLRMLEPDASLFYPPAGAKLRAAKDMKDLLSPFPNAGK